MDYTALRQLDAQDALRKFQDEFHFPLKNGKKAIYFCGNSLGLQPKRTAEYLNRELELWKSHGVEGHFTGEMPWVSYHEWAKKPLGHLIGALETEVQAVGSLTANLHFLLASFYQPKGKRVKIIIEQGAFPSDFYAVHSHMLMKGVDPDAHLIELKSTNKNGYLPTPQILEKIKEAGEELALVLMPGVQYYTGQFFNIGDITRAAHEVGAYAGFDLAHAIGNLPMHLHDDKVDFAVWCSYKYLNSGPGGIGGMYIHEKHASNKAFPRLSGWWGHDAKERFEMKNRINPIANVDGWQLSNANVLSTAAHLASLSLFEEAGIENLRAKSIQMTEWLAGALENFADHIEILTPSTIDERGCQFSMFMKVANGKEVFNRMTQKGVIADWREPNVIRIAPTPMYNSFEELGRFIEIMEESLHA